MMMDPAATVKAEGTTTTGIDAKAIEQFLGHSVEMSPRDVYDMEKLHRKASEHVEQEFADSMEDTVASLEQLLKQFNDLYEHQLNVYNEGNHDIEVALENAVELHELLQEIVNQNVRTLANQIEDSLIVFQEYMSANRDKFKIDPEEVQYMKEISRREKDQIRARLGEHGRQAKDTQQLQQDALVEDEDEDFLTLDDDEGMISTSTQSPEELEMMQRMQEHNTLLKQQIARRKHFFREQTLEQEQAYMQNTFSEQMMNAFLYIQRQFFFMMLNLRGLRSKIKSLEESSSETAGKESTGGEKSSTRAVNEKESSFEPDDVDAKEEREEIRNEEVVVDVEATTLQSVDTTAEELSRLKQHETQMVDMLRKYQQVNRQLYALLKHVGEVTYILGDYEETDDKEWSMEGLARDFSKATAELEAELDDEVAEASRIRHIQRRLPTFVFTSFVLPWHQVRFWNRILYTSVESRDFEHVVGLTTEMKDYQVRTNPETYRHFVRFLLLGRQYTQVHKLLEYMRQNGIKPDAETQEMLVKMESMQS